MSDEERQDEDVQADDPANADEAPAGASDEVADPAAEGAQGGGAEPADTGREAEDVGGGVQEAPEPPSESGEPEPAGADAEASEASESGAAGGGAQEAPETPSESPKPKPKDQAPGADLEPIALEPERELSAEERARAEAEAEERASAEAEVADDGVDDEPLTRSAVKLDPEASIQATGKRKSAIARVVLRPGDGTFEINSRKLEEYFPRHQHQTMARQPLVTAGYEGTVDIRVRVHGGGVAGQAGAVRHGIARALTEVDPELRGELKRRGLLTRDAREKERRKAGLKKARKRPQFSKR